MTDEIAAAPPAATAPQSDEDETEAEKIIRAAWKLLSRLEEAAVEDTMYDGRPVEEWCDRAIKYLGDDTRRESQSNALAEIENLVEATLIRGDLQYGLGQIADVARRARGA